MHARHAAVIKILEKDVEAAIAERTGYIPSGSADEGEAHPINPIGNRGERRHE